MVKELNETMKTTFHQVENIYKDRENIFLKSHVEISELKVTIIEMKIVLKELSRIISKHGNMKSDQQRVCTLKRRWGKRLKEM